MSTYIHVCVYVAACVCLRVYVCVYTLISSQLPLPRWQLPDGFDCVVAGEGGGGSPLPATDTSLQNSMDPKASHFRSTMHYATPGGVAGNKDGEVPLIYNGYNPASPYNANPPAHILNGVTGTVHSNGYTR